MRLIKVQLVGFKSFAEPTTFVLKGSLNAIVGPNGCGKSNLIDAVRWVLGESSAKYLRGDHMTDVIFNGSQQRKPAMQTSVELVFDHIAEHSPWSQYAELSVKRLLSREGKSTYFLNNIPCRRKDITDLLSGTGLSTRAYAIIEQGMISKIVEAQPEHLRSLFEEAAGIAKYKERRHETMRSISNTRDNLSRLEDIHHSLINQHQQLLEQAETAQQYQTLKSQERDLQYRLLYSRNQHVASEITRVKNHLHALNNTLETVAHTRKIALEQHHLLKQKLALAQKDHQSCLQTYQTCKETYLVAETQSKYEMTQLAAQEASHVQWQAQSQQLQANLIEDEQHIQQRQTQLASATFEYTLLEEQCEMSQIQHQTDTLAYEQQCQQSTILQYQIDQTEREIERLELQLEHQQQRLHDHQQRLVQWQQPLTLDSDDTDYAQLQTDYAQTQLEETQANITLNELIAQVDIIQTQYQMLNHTKQQQLEQIAECNGQLNALIQQQTTQQQRLQTHKQTQQPLLFECLNIQPPWQMAAAASLQQWLILPFRSELDEQMGFGGTQSYSFTPNDIGYYIDSPHALGSFLSHIKVAHNYSDALILRPQLQLHQWIALENGDLMGKDWFLPMTARQQDFNVNLFIRAETIKSLEITISNYQQTLAITSDSIAECTRQLDTLHQHIETLQQTRQHILTTQQSYQHQLMQHEQARLHHAQQSKERAELCTQELEIITHLQTVLATYQTQMTNLMLQKETLIEQHETQQQQTQMAQLHHERSQQHYQQQQQQRIQAEQLITQHQNALTTLQANYQRNQDQYQQLQNTLLQFADLNLFRQQCLQKKAQLTELEQQSTIAHHAVQISQENFDTLQETLQQQEYIHQQYENEYRDLTTEQQEVALQHATLTERYAYLEQERHELWQQLSSHEKAQLVLEKNLTPNAIKSLEKKLQQTRLAIQTLGSINLRAIEEAAILQQQCTDSAQQINDLYEAIKALETTITAIDETSRQRFLDTFNNINQVFIQLFAQLFEGGHATLQLEQTDPLSANIQIIARPPGKKPSTIHLLSGGEKALTAMALIFAMFSLNPAPFCILDEVDAPLDETNVRRFGQLIQQYAKNMQFIFITHNKHSMTIADHLMGVTMSEAGVSRLVSVDLHDFQS